MRTVVETQLLVVMPTTADARRNVTSIMSDGTLTAGRNSGDSAAPIFVVSRLLNAYGDPLAWSIQRDDAFTLMSFLNVAKYPPSLDYTLITLGVAVAIAPALARLRGPFAKLLEAFVRTPQFTYLLHILLIHCLAMAVAMALGTRATISPTSSPIRAAWWTPVGIIHRRHLPRLVGSHNDPLAGICLVRARQGTPPSLVAEFRLGGIIFAILKLRPAAESRQMHSSHRHVSRRDG